MFSGQLIVGKVTSSAYRKGTSSRVAAQVRGAPGAVRRVSPTGRAEPLARPPVEPVELNPQLSFADGVESVARRALR